MRMSLLRNWSRNTNTSVTPWILQRRAVKALNRWANSALRSTFNTGLSLGSDGGRTTASLDPARDDASVVRVAALGCRDQLVILS